MPVNFSAGTDQLVYQILKTGTSALTSIGSAAIKFSTTTVVVNSAFYSAWASNSLEGWGMVLNTSGFSIAAIGRNASAGVMALTTNVKVNDGNEHVAVFNYNTNNGSTSQLWLDGTLVATATSSADWSISYTGHSPVVLGRNQDSFWGNWAGTVFECAGWGRWLTAGEISAIQSGISMGRIARDAQQQSVANGGSWPNPQACWHMPFNGDRGNRFNGVLAATGTTITPQVQVISPNFA